MTATRKLTELLRAHRQTVIADPPKFDRCICKHIGDHEEHKTKIIDTYRHELQVFPTGKAVIHESGCECGPCSTRRGAQASLNRRW